MGKVLSFLQLINNSPLLSAGLFAVLRATVSRACEKEADLVSATTLNNAQGGIDFFKSMEQPATQDSLFNWLNPLYVLKKIEHSPVLSSHPSNQERIDYLSELATQQNSQKVFENCFKNSATLTA
jgi:Zn-dependent protease with chaperone function